MNKIVKLIPLCLVFISCTSGAQSVDDIINKNIEAKGGLKNINTVQTLVFNGTITNRGNLVPIKLFYDHGKAMRSEFTFSNGSAYTILTRTAGWRFSPFDTLGVLTLKDWEISDGAFQLDVHGVYIDYKKKGYTAEYLGKDTVMGKNCDKIKLTKKGEGDKIYLFDDQYMLVKTMIERKNASGNYVAGVNYYLDYKKNEDGYLFSYTRKTGNETITFTNITANAFLPELLFMPN